MTLRSNTDKGIYALLTIFAMGAYFSFLPTGLALPPQNTEDRVVLNGCDVFQKRRAQVALLEGNDHRVESEIIPTLLSHSSQVTGDELDAVARHFAQRARLAQKFGAAAHRQAASDPLTAPLLGLIHPATSDEARAAFIDYIGDLFDEPSTTELVEKSASTIVVAIRSGLFLNSTSLLTYEALLNFLTIPAVRSIPVFQSLVSEAVIRVPWRGREGVAIAEQVLKLFYYYPQAVGDGQWSTHIKIMLDESGKSKISLEAVIIAMESRAHMNEAPVLFGALVQNLPPRDGELLLRAAREINRRATETHDLKPSDAADLLAKMITRYRAARGGAATPSERTPVLTTLTALRWGLSK